MKHILTTTPLITPNRIVDITHIPKNPMTRNKNEYQPAEMQEHNITNSKRLVKRVTLSQQVHAKYHILRNGHTNYPESSATD